MSKLENINKKIEKNIISNYKKFKMIELKEEKLMNKIY